MEAKDKTFHEQLEELAARTAKIRELSVLQITDINDADSYGDLLREHFKEIGRLASENRIVLEDTLYPLLEKGRICTPYETSELKALYDHLLNGHQLGDLDCRLLHLVSRRLLSDAEKSGKTGDIIAELDRHITACYELSHQTKRMKTAEDMMDSYRREGLKASDEILSWFDSDRLKTLEDAESRRRVLFNSRYHTVFYEKSGKDDDLNSSSLNALIRSYEITKDQEYLYAAPEYDWHYHTLRVLEYIGQETEIGNVRGFSREQCIVIADHMDQLEAYWNKDPEGNTPVITSSGVALLCCRNRYLAGRIEIEEYRDSLRRIYQNRKSDEYDFYDVLDNLLVPLELLITYEGKECNEEEQQEFDEIYRQTINYVFRTPDIGTYELLLEYFSELLYHFREFPGGIGFEEMGLSCLAALHPPTYVHSIMVGRISRCICEELLLREPEAFSGSFGCSDKKEVIRQKDKIADFCEHAARCHDFGKLPMIDTISVYGRRLMESEFSLLKHHPAAGAEMLAAHDSTRDYAPVALGHHRFYDDCRGYPNDFSAEKCSLRTIVDIVTVADSLDAATDTVGRSYSTGKDIQTIFDEIRSQSGSRYAPYIADLLSEPQVFERISTILQKDRKQCYKDTWLLLRQARNQ